MFEKNLNISYLLDFYGVLLSERKRTVMDMYYNEDLSLSEIADEIGISRQGVRDIIKKSEEELFFFEERLGLARKLRDAEAVLSELEGIAKEQGLDSEIRQRLSALAELIRQ